MASCQPLISLSLCQRALAPGKETADSVVMVLAPPKCARIDPLGMISPVIADRHLNDRGPNVLSRPFR